MGPRWEKSCTALHQHVLISVANSQQPVLRQKKEEGVVKIDGKMVSSTIMQNKKHFEFYDATEWDNQTNYTLSSTIASEDLVDPSTLF